MSFQNCLSCPLSVGLELFLCFCFLHMVLSIIKLFFFFVFAQNFWILWIFLHAPKLCLGTLDYWKFFFMPPSVSWALSVTEVFSVIALAPSMECDPNQCYLSQEKVLGSKGECKWYILASWTDYQKWHFLISNSCT